MNRLTIRPLVAAGMMLGIGLMALFDGIVFHQILQFHNMLSAKYAPISTVNLEINMFWDGMFHAFAFLTTGIGIAMLWNAARRAEVYLSTRGLIAGILLGGGLFNVIEGIIDHHVLHIHHVREIENHLPWDIGFLAVSTLLAIVGIAMVPRQIPNAAGPASRGHFTAE